MRYLASLPAFLATGVFLLGCSDGGGDGTAGPDSRTFPSNFLWGTAIAGFQADMGCPTLPASACDDENSDWYQFITSPVFLDDPGLTVSKHPPSAGPGHWELYETDLGLAKNELKNNAFRTSIEWSRIFPAATDGITGYEALGSAADAGAVAHYHDLFRAMRARGIKPLVTLNHYSLPLWIHDAAACHQDLAACSPRGWFDNDRTVREIAKFAGFVAQEFGGEVDLWATLNEPLQNTVFGYLLPVESRTHPPALLLQIEAFKTGTIALIEAHARMYDAVKAADTLDADGDGQASMVGVVFPMTPGYPKDPANPTDVRGAENYDYLWNRVYMDAVAKGQLDAALDGNVVHRDDLAGRMDYIGLNYYFAFDIEGVEQSPWPDLSPLLTFNVGALLQSRSDPRGLYEMLKRLDTEYGLPIIVTENGATDPNDDGSGPEFLVRHLTWVARAKKAGVDVRGYFYWTFMDNYEWNHGMNIRMGMYAVDMNDPSKRRTARRAVSVYRGIIERGEIGTELEQMYPEAP
jgi:beta-galactosidase